MGYDIDIRETYRVVNGEGKIIASCDYPGQADEIIAALMFLGSVPPIWRAGFQSGLTGRGNNPFGPGAKASRALFAAGASIGKAVRLEKITNTHVGVVVNADRS